jgi:hypothetical protein
MMMNFEKDPEEETTGVSVCHEFGQMKTTGRPLRAVDDFRRSHRLGDGRLFAHLAGATAWSDPAGAGTVAGAGTMTVWLTGTWWATVRV